MLKRTILWTIIAVLMIAALWALKIEATYQNNVRHIPAGFHIRPHHTTHMWKV